MKKIIAVFILSILFSFAHFSNASEETHKKTTDELFDVMGVKEMENQGFEQLKQMFMEQINPMLANIEDASKIKSIKEKIADMLSKEISWEKLKSEYVKLYMGTLNEEEMKEVIAFYKTPAGQKLMDKIPELMDKSMRIGEKKVTDLMPVIGNMIKGPDSGKQEQQKKEMPKDQMHMQMNKR